MDKDSIGLSLTQSVTVRGYEIKRAPLGAYLQALKQLQSFPKEVTAALFPGQNADQVLEALKHLNSDALLALVARALTVVPDRALALVAKLAGINVSLWCGGPKARSRLTGKSAYCRACTAIPCRAGRSACTRPKSRCRYCAT